MTRPNRSHVLVLAVLLVTPLAGTFPAAAAAPDPCAVAADCAAGAWYFHRDGHMDASASSEPATLHVEQEGGAFLQRTAPLATDLVLVRAAGLDLHLPDRQALLTDEYTTHVTVSVHHADGTPLLDAAGDPVVLAQTSAVATRPGIAPAVAPASETLDALATVADAIFDAGLGSLLLQVVDAFCWDGADRSPPCDSLYGRPGYGGIRPCQADGTILHQLHPYTNRSALCTPTLRQRAQPTAEAVDQARDVLPWNDTLALVRQATDAPEPLAANWSEIHLDLLPTPALPGGESRIIVPAGHLVQIAVRLEARGVVPMPDDAFRSHLEPAAGAVPVPLVPDEASGAAAMLLDAVPGHPALDGRVGPIRNATPLIVDAANNETPRQARDALLLHADGLDRHVGGVPRPLAAFPYDGHGAPARLEFVEHTPQDVDLALQYLAVAASGSDVRVQTAFANVGTTAMRAPFVVEFRLDGETTERQTWPALPPGQLVVATAFMRAPPGAHVTTVILDPDGVVSERSEANNEASASFDVEEPGLADLWITAPPRIVVPDGAWKRVWFTAGNSGHRHSGPFGFEVRLDGETLTRDNWSGLRERSQWTSYVDVRAQGAGNHTLELVLDAGHDVAETDESNNVATIILEVFPVPDVRVDAFDLQRAPIRTEFGDVRHPLSRWVVTVRLCNEGQLDARDVWLHHFVYGRSWGDATTTTFFAHTLEPGRCWTRTHEFYTPGVVGDFEAGVWAAQAHDADPSDNFAQASGYNLVTGEGGYVLPQGVLWR